jgi:hypothetical protein
MLAHGKHGSLKGSRHTKYMHNSFLTLPTPYASEGVTSPTLVNVSPILKCEQTTLQRHQESGNFSWRLGQAVISIILLPKVLRARVQPLFSAEGRERQLFFQVLSMK